MNIIPLCNDAVWSIFYPRMLCIASRQVLDKKYSILKCFLCGIHSSGFFSSCFFNIFCLTSLTSIHNVYQFLLFFYKRYDRFTDIEKKTFLKSFLDSVCIYEEAKKDGRILKGLKFKFPIFWGGREITELDWDNESTVETVCLLERVEK